jgi:hypothetical protein
LHGQKKLEKHVVTSKHLPYSSHVGTPFLIGFAITAGDGRLVMAMDGLMTALKQNHWVDYVFCLVACTLLACKANADEWRGKSAEQQLGSRAEELADGPLPPNSDFSSEMLRKLMRPSFDFAAEWQAETNDVGLASYDASVKFPTFPLSGPPPPFINVGFSYTDVDAPTALGLPTELFET